jgi:hypothetical protein
MGPWIAVAVFGLVLVGVSYGLYRGARYIRRRRLGERGKPLPQYAIVWELGLWLGIVWLLVGYAVLVFAMFRGGAFG